MPIPAETDEEFHTLATSLSQKLEMMVAKAKQMMRDPGMTTTECIFLAAGFIFCVLMLADMGLVQ